MLNIFKFFSSSSLIRIISTCFVAFILFVVLLSYQGLRGLHSVAGQFDHLSNRAFPLAITNAQLVQAILENTKLMSAGIRTTQQDQLTQIRAGIDQKINATQSLLEQLKQAVDESVQHNSLTKAQVDTITRNVDTFVSLSRSLMSIQAEKLKEQVQLKDAADTFRYGVSSIGPEMNRIANMLAFENPEAMDAANRFVANAAKMESLFLMLMMEKDEGAAQKFYKTLRTRESAVSLAFDDFREMYPDVSEFASLTAPYELMEKGFADHGVIKQVLAQIDLIHKQDEQLNQAISIATETIQKLDEISQGASQQIKNNQSLVKETLSLTTSAQIWFMVIAIIVLVIVWFLLRRWVLHSLRHILTELHSLAQKDFSDNLIESGPSELRSVARNLNEVVDAIRLSLNQVTETSSSLYQASEISHQASESSQRRLTRQNEALAGMSTTMTEIEASISEIASITGETHQESQLSVAHAQKGLDVLLQNQNALKSLNARLDSSDDAMNELVERVDQIQGMVNLISGIAENTNLLALNAAIEAARAGEQGRGFAVVADEVRKLASGTSEQTTNIRQLMSELVTSANRSRQAVNDSRQQMSLALESGEEVKSSFTSIESSVQGICARVEQISVAAEQQEKATAEVNHSIALIAEQGQQTALSLQEVVGSAGQVSDIANQQQTMLSQYQLSQHQRSATPTVAASA
ncbi:methyl-accepting chemotaxis protein [Vibrio gazogenes]|uniref:Methyl-accepting chemotaxis protein n=1 Tax=Vibrio gazogenes DSM 21264 = NBRC 103151 TaxID=1123492 RepID=A0A1M4ZI04_VIBGA|nr:methyl-accepting chemotaxis protein [Vibrio gazogenes]USP12399.1 methyl-accepting chemotaxis protein [Vibrio gazogenes]SHF17631.1 methyl-accepting chemotaxis protein [Vibrio gazogenes DSM 21264] [Vibrio gazogenes DSM 21264 = NBRC 103151]